MKPIPIGAAKEVAHKYGYDQVIIIARKVGDDPAPHGEHCTTYGRNKEHCDVAARVGNFIKFKVMGWVKEQTTDHAPLPVSPAPALFTDSLGRNPQPREPAPAEPSEVTVRRMRSEDWPDRQDNAGEAPGTADELLKMIAGVEADCSKRERNGIDGVARLAWASAGDTAQRIYFAALAIISAAPPPADEWQDMQNMFLEYEALSQRAHSYLASGNEHDKQRLIEALVHVGVSLPSYAAKVRAMNAAFPSHPQKNLENK